MLKRVDSHQDKIKGYSYINQDNKEEYVGISDAGGIVAIATFSPDLVCTHIYKEDIPNLIKALEAAYDHKD